MNPSLLDRRWLVLAATLPIIALAALMGSLLPASHLDPLIIENGPFEMTSVGLHLVVGLSALFLWRKGYAIAGLLSLASLLMAAREVDLHKAFTTYGLFKTRLYVDASVPLIEKLLAGAAVLILLGLIVYMAWKARKDVGLLWRERRGAFFGLISLPVYLIVLKEVDGLPRMLRKAGMALSERGTLVSRSIEEVGETFIPALVLIVLMQVVIAARTPRRISR